MGLGFEVPEWGLLGGKDQGGRLHKGKSFMNIVVSISPHNSSDKTRCTQIPASGGLIKMMRHVKDLDVDE